MAADFIGLFGPSFEDEENEETINILDGDELPDALPPECAEGNIEYKLKLVNPTQSRFEHLVTQLNWRLREGRSNCSRPFS